MFFSSAHFGSKFPPVDSILIDYRFVARCCHVATIDASRRVTRRGRVATALEPPKSASVPVVRAPCRSSPALRTCHAVEIHAARRWPARYIPVPRNVTMASAVRWGLLVFNILFYFMYFYFVSKPFQLTIDSSPNEWHKSFVALHIKPGSTWGCTFELALAGR